MHSQLLLVIEWAKTLPEFTQLSSADQVRQNIEQNEKTVIELIKRKMCASSVLDSVLKLQSECIPIDKKESFSSFPF